MSIIQGGEDPLDILSFRSFFCKRVTNYRGILQNVRHPKGRLYPVMCAVVRMMCAMSAANEVIFCKKEPLIIRLFCGK